ncbi:glycosyltransferase family 4 protein [Ulvibacter antarcticus]|uniref:Glycosyltransferase involved in cell wall biosynthesis n=1 Tax=Ulvibacter antarcticus TaxID=442714 RepID=A0A3L9YU62_9FLAO|nr:glycosyltransferase family 4 protein [Ulvibacter antarcticus]RMA64291.1 glycosyltransferase involved in cell wall biosynthesis [Ulvibacter antarcticus]
MKISWFTENYPPNRGGMSRSCDRIIANLRKHHTVDIYHFTNKFEPFFSEANIGGLYTAIPMYEDSSHSLNLLWAFIKDNAEIAQSDVFVGFGSHLCIKGIPLMATWLKKPLLSCFRGNDFDTAIFSQKKQSLLFAIENSNAIACVSREKVERIKRLNLNRNVFYTPNSIDASQWEVLKSDRELAGKLKKDLALKNTTVIGIIGFLKQKKGVDFFISCLKKSRLASNVHLRIVGEIEPHLETLLIQKDIAYTICVPGAHTQLTANYLLCDAVAIPSIYDGMPNVIFEAAILNIPIIASNAGGIPDILDETNAFVFKVLSEASLIETLDEYASTPSEKRLEKSFFLKEKVLSEFSPEIETKNYLDIFKNITHQIKIVQS